ACLLRPPAREPVGEHDRIHRARRGSRHAFDRKPAVSEQMVEHAPGESAVRAAALQREVDLLGIRSTVRRVRGRAPTQIARPSHPVARVELADALHCAVQPPSIEILAPVIAFAASDVRYTASAATSSIVTNSLVGCAASSTSRLTCSAVMLRVFIWSGIW